PPAPIPLGAPGRDPRPAEGGTGAAEWTGCIPSERLPPLYDPPDHVIVTATPRPAPPSYPFLLGFEWPEPYRAQRIGDLMRTKSKFTPDDFARMQADTVSLHARTLLPLLLAPMRAAGTPA